MSIIVGVLALVLGCWLGYQFCMARYRPKFMLDVMEIQNKAITGELKPEEATKQLNDLKKKHPSLVAELHYTGLNLDD